jgi:hypothetical protein
MAKTLSTLRNAFAQRPDSGARRPQAKPSGEIPRKDSTRALDKLGEIRLPRKLLRAFATTSGMSMGEIRAGLAALEAKGFLRRPTGTGKTYELTIPPRDGGRS